MAREKFVGNVLAYVLYSREAKGIYVNGERGVVVHPEARRRHIGTNLMDMFAKQDLPITFENVNRKCGLSCAFLRSLGVDIPEPPQFLTYRVETGWLNAVLFDFWPTWGFLQVVFY